MKEKENNSLSERDQRVTVGGVQMFITGGLSTGTHTQKKCPENLKEVSSPAALKKTIYRVKLLFKYQKILLFLVPFYSGAKCGTRTTSVAVRVCYFSYVNVAFFMGRIKDTRGSFLNNEQSRQQ